MSDESVVECSELQAVDFAFGAFLAEVFAPLDKETGPKEWREFLARPLKEQILRGAYESPADFIKALQASGVKSPKLPVVYYFRKPGFTNSESTKGTKGKSQQNVAKFFDITLLNISLDYRLYFLAWDTPSLDKLGLAWYRHINSISSTFPVSYRIDTEEFDIKCFVDDNRTVTLTDSSVLYGDSGRLYAIMTGLTIKTQVLFGNAVPIPPEFITIEVGLQTHRSERYVIDVGDGNSGTFRFDSASRFGKPRPLRTNSIIVNAGRTIAGTDNGLGAIAGTFTISAVDYVLSGTVNYDLGTIDCTVTPALPSGFELSVQYETGDGVVEVFTQ